MRKKNQAEETKDGLLHFGVVIWKVSLCSCFQQKENVRRIGHLKKNADCIAEKEKE